MKALVRVPGGVEVAEQPDPVTGPEDVVVAVHSCGICGSDVHAAEANAGQSHGIPGARVFGDDCRTWPRCERLAYRPGGGGQSTRQLWQCEWCQREMFIRCTGRPNLGLGAPGGFAEYVAAHHSQLFALPEGCRWSRLARGAAGGRAAGHFRGRRPAGLNAIVFGVGPIGLHLIRGLRALGANQIVAVGRSSVGRRLAASRVGADVVLDSRETDVADYVAEHGIEVAQAYECSADPQALVVLERAVRLAGTIVAVALGWAPAAFDTHLFVGKGQRMFGACAYGNRDFGRRWS